MCDFGYSKHAKDSLPKSKVGTPGYTAPEVISNKRHYDGVMADVWSSGVMLFVMLFGQYPFERPEDKKEQNRFQKVLYRIIAVDYKFPDTTPHGPVSENVKDLIRRIFVADPKRRITIQQIQQHPWYQQDLPPGLTGFNDICLAQQRASGAPVGSQDEAVIRAVVQEAKTVKFAGSDQPVFHDEIDNDFIDDVMDNEYSLTDRDF
jgi:serine/threonine-protein kinase SRK2